MNVTVDHSTFPREKKNRSKWNLYLGMDGVWNIAIHSIYEVKWRLQSLIYINVIMLWNVTKGKIPYPILSKNVSLIKVNKSPLTSFNNSIRIISCQRDIFMVTVGHWLELETSTFDFGPGKENNPNVFLPWRGKEAIQIGNYLKTHT